MAQGLLKIGPACEQVQIPSGMVSTVNVSTCTCLHKNGMVQEPVKALV